MNNELPNQHTDEYPQDVKRAALLVATLGSFLTPLMGSSINVALPTIGEEFAMNAVLLSWVATSFILAAAMFLVPFGKLADIYGRVRIFKYGMIIYTFSSILSAVSNTGGFLIASRVVQGLGSAMIFGTSIAILTSVFPPGERGRALGINVAAVYLGLSVGPFFGGFLTENFGWRSIFYIMAVVGVIVIVLYSVKLKGEWAGAKDEKFDLPGTIVYGLSLVSLMYGFTLLPDYFGFIPIAAGVVCFGLFVWIELKVKYPVLNIDLFLKNRVFAFSNIAALINYSATFAIAFLVSLYLQYIKGLGPQDAGLVLVSQPVMMMLFSPFAGKLSDKVESRTIASIGMAFTVLGLVMLTTLDTDTSLKFIIFSLGLLGFGFALFSSPNTNAIMSSVEKRYYGVASATVATMRLTGQMMSMGIAMLIFSMVIGKVQITPDYYPQFLTSVYIIFVIFAILCFIGVFASLARGRIRKV